MRHLNEQGRKPAARRDWTADVSQSRDVVTTTNDELEAYHTTILSSITTSLHDIATGRHVSSTCFQLHNFYYDRPQPLSSFPVQYTCPLCPAGQQSRNSKVRAIQEHRPH